MQDPIDNKIINWVTSVTIEPYLFICMYQILLSDFKLGNKSIDCKTQTIELKSSNGPIGGPLSGQPGHSGLSQILILLFESCS